MFSDEPLPPLSECLEGDAAGQNGSSQGSSGVRDL